MTIVLAPAKLTTRLALTGLRADGYHLIDAEMVSLDLADEITLTEIDNGPTTITVSGPYAAGVPTDTRNLVHGALEMLDRQAQVHLTKNIPHGGGLGGGSSDAAAILRWGGFNDLAAAARLGADVAYCLIGGRAHVTGIGEIVTPLPHTPAVLTLIIPPVAVSTPAAYRAYDALIADNPTATAGLINHLEPAALRVEPTMKIWKSRITDLVGQAPRLAGSGSTWFVPGDHSRALTALTELGATVVRTLTVDR